MGLHSTGFGKTPKIPREPRQVAAAGVIVAVSSDSWRVFRARSRRRETVEGQVEIEDFGKMCQRSRLCRMKDWSLTRLQNGEAFAVEEMLDSERDRYRLRLPRC